MKTLLSKSLAVYATIINLGTFVLTTKIALAGCNPFGCSSVPNVECNPFGCPIPPNGAACNPFGCPPAQALPNSDGDPRDFNIQNDAELPISQVYIRPTNVNNAIWSSDRLGDSSIRSNTIFRVHMNSYPSEECYFDIKAVYSDSTYDYSEGENLCNIKTKRYVGHSGDYK